MYVPKEATCVAIQLDLNIVGGSFQYTKWGDTQTAKVGDFIKFQGGSTHTVDRVSFLSTHELVDPAQPGIYRKVHPVYAEVCLEPGFMPTKENQTALRRGDMIVSNDAEGTDTWGMSIEKFCQRYTNPDGSEIDAEALLEEAGVGTYNHD